MKIITFDRLLIKFQISSKYKYKKKKRIINVHRTTPIRPTQDHSGSPQEAPQ